MSAGEGMSTSSTQASSRSPLPDAAILAKGMAALRIFVGLIALLNGLAKLLNFRDIEIGVFKANLITLAETRQILEFEANGRGGTGTEVPGLKTLVNDVILANYSIAEVLITATELGVGVALVLGIATRAGALVGLGQHLFLALLYASSNRWLFEQPHEWVPLVILALVPAGRMWGLDARLVQRRPALRRWPF
ncbi:MAG: DoxX family membrane protein [Solirubrobacterales bacterium]|nr:DoxX family membrane protein [Solirubrobacterales bacterium]